MSINKILRCIAQSKAKDKGLIVVSESFTKHMYVAATQVGRVGNEDKVMLITFEDLYKNIDTYRRKSADIKQAC